MVHQQPYHSPAHQRITTLFVQRSPEGAIAQRYVWTPDPLIIAFAHDPLTVGIYVAVARLAYAARGAVPLAARDLAAWMGRDTDADRAAIMRRIVKLAQAGWLVVERHSTHKHRLLPTWGPDQTGHVRPWYFDADDSGKPAHLRGRRVPLSLFDDYLGRLDPQPGHRRALISRYLSRPLLDLTDIGVYAIGLRAEIAPTPRLCHLATTGVHPLPQGETLLARAASGQLTTIDDGSAVAVELTALGQARLAAIGRADVACSTARMSGSSPGSIAGSPARSATGSTVVQPDVPLPAQQDAEKGATDPASSLIAWDERDAHEQTNHDSAASDGATGGGAAISGRADDAAEQLLTTGHADRQRPVPSLLPPFLVPEVARGHLALNSLRPLPPGEWHELLSLQQTYGAEQLLIWQARASRRAQSHPFGITPGYYRACAAAQALITAQRGVPVAGRGTGSAQSVEGKRTTSAALDPWCDALLRAMGIRERRQLAGVSHDLITAWQTALDHPGMAAHFATPLGFAVSQMRLGNAPPSQEELDRWVAQAQRSADRYEAWRHVEPVTASDGDAHHEVELEARVRALAPPDASLADLCTLAGLLEDGCTDAEALMRLQATQHGGRP